jgi:uncharacterized lipoprotein YmbA
MRWGSTSMVLLLAITANACGRSAPVRYYALDAPKAVAPTLPGPRVSVGPATLPEAVDRPQMVLRADDNRLIIDDAHRWGAPLKRELPRILAAHLTALVPRLQFAADSQNAAVDADLRLLLDVQRLDSTLGDSAVIQVLWTLKGRNGKRLDSGSADASETVANSSHAALAAAHSSALARIAEQIAVALRSVVAEQ